MSKKKKKFYITTAIDYIKEFYYNISNGKEKVCFPQEKVKRVVS